MRFIVLAFALLAFGLYLSQPQAFGRKDNFQSSNNGRVVIHQPGSGKMNIGEITAAGAELFDSVAGRLFDSAPEAPQSAANPAVGVAEAALDTLDSPATPLILSTTQQPDLTSYNGRLDAIYTALTHNQKSATTAMQDATKSCLSSGSSDILVNYFVQIVQITANTAQQPDSEKPAYFAENSAPLTNLIKVWLSSLPAEDSALATAELESWATRPIELVACHTAWLGQAH